MSPEKCTGTKTSTGGPCRGWASPESAFCKFHDPDPAMREQVTAMRRRGAKETARVRRARRFAPVEDAPSAPETIADCLHWLSWTTHSVATGILDPKVAREIANLLREFRQALEGSDLSKRLGALEDAITEAKRSKLKAL